MDHDTKLYLITPPRLTDEAAFLRQLETALSTGHITAVQLRLKLADDKTADLDAMRRIAPDFVACVQQAGAVALINDAADIAEETYADGVHLGQTDGSIKATRQRLGEDAIIGATCHDSRHLAMVAGEAGATYVAFGAFYPTDTKTTEHRPDPDILTWWQEVMEIPCVAIGGITAENAAFLAGAGADFLAVSSYVWTHTGGPAESVAALHDAIQSALG